MCIVNKDSVLLQAADYFVEDRKIDFIRAIRALSQYETPEEGVFRSNMGLKEAKDFADALFACKRDNQDNNDSDFVQDLKVIQNCIDNIKFMTSSSDAVEKLKQLQLHIIEEYFS